MSEKLALPWADRRGDRRCARQGGSLRTMRGTKLGTGRCARQGGQPGDHAGNQTGHWAVRQAGGQPGDHAGNQTGHRAVRQVDYRAAACTCACACSQRAVTALAARHGTRRSPLLAQTTYFVKPYKPL
eukprot:72206-Chlamydomonas_euryale.AAC.2